MAAIDSSLPSLLPRAEPLQGLQPGEMQRLQAMLGNGKRQDTAIHVNESGVTLRLGEEDLSNTATVIFKTCLDGVYTIASTCTKVVIDSCANCTFTFAGKVVTNTVEVYKSASCTFNVDTKVSTLQVDLCTAPTVVFSDLEHFQQVIWAGSTDIDLRIAGVANGLVTGYDHMRALRQFSNIREDIDQFIIRLVNGALLSEKIVRLVNGFPSTQREIDDFESRQEANMRAMAKEILGEDIIIPKKVEKKAKRNELCACGSGKKAKKCSCTLVKLS